MKIQPIVEGHGDVAALPILLRRLVNEAEIWAADIGRPIRRPRSRLVKEEEIQRAVRLALLQPDCGAVLILFDGDDDCPADVGPTLQAWATAAANGIPCGSCWRTGNTKPGFWRQSNRCGVIVASGTTRNLIRPRRVLAAPRSNWKRGWSQARRTSKRRTNRRSAHGSRCRPPTVDHGRSGSSRLRSESWSTPWGTTSGCGRHPPGPRAFEAVVGGVVAARIARL